MTPRRRHPPARSRSLIPLLVPLLFLLAFGVLMVFNASAASDFHQFNDPLRTGRLQLGWSLFGLLIMFLLSRTPVRWLQPFSRWLFIFSLCLLILVLIPNFSSPINGARRWFSLGFFSLQPSELIKFAVVLYFPLWLPRTQSFLRLLVLVFLILGLILLQPDLGTAIILGGLIFMLVYLANYPLLKLGLTLLLGLLVGFGAIMLSPYRQARLATFFDPNSDPLGRSYHIRQILSSIVEGGLFGTGVGRSRAKYQSLPESATDSIFAVIVEETGLLGGLGVILAYLSLVTYGLLATLALPTLTARLTAQGIILWIGLQALVNLAAMVGLIPLTGVPLPFISYGGSSLITLLSGLGIYFSLFRRP